MFSLASIQIVSQVPLCDSISSSLRMKNVYQNRFWLNSMGQTYIAPIKKETHSFGLITPQCNGCVDHLRLLWNSLCAPAARPWRCQHEEECASLWKGWVRLTPMGCVGIGLRSKAWSSGERRRWTATVRVGDVPTRICIPGDRERGETERERDRQREIQDFYLSHYLLAHDKPNDAVQKVSWFIWMRTGQIGL